MGIWNWRGSQRRGSRGWTSFPSTPFYVRWIHLGEHCGVVKSRYITFNALQGTPSWRLLYIQGVHLGGTSKVFQKQSSSKSIWNWWIWWNVGVLCYSRWPHRILLQQRLQSGLKFNLKRVGIIWKEWGLVEIEIIVLFFIGFLVNRY
jgi:hypothetical protein